jgi:heme exporter protein B
MILRGAAAVLAKDARCELRSKQAISAVLLFAVTSTIAVSFTLGAIGSDSAVASTLLWIVIYFSAMAGLGRSFAHEEETYTAGLLRLAVPAESVYVGKLAFNFLTLMAVEIVTVPLFVLLTDCHIARMGAFVGMVLLGSLALSAGATTAAAMVSRAASKGALFAGVSFPLLAPALGIAIAGTSAALGHSPHASAAMDARLLVYYCGVVIIASLMLFRYIWEE